MMLTNDVAELSGVVNLTLADVRLDTNGQDCSFDKIGKHQHSKPALYYACFLACVGIRKWKGICTGDTSSSFFYKYDQPIWEIIFIIFE